MNPLQLVRDNVVPWNKKSIVFVHGIGDHSATFAAPLVETLRNQDPLLVDAARWYGVAYDFVHDAMVQKLKLVENDIPAPGPGAAGGSAFADVATENLLDLVNYLGTNDLNNWINSAYKKALAEIVKRGIDEGVPQSDHGIYIISHSLGTVVTYEVLHSIISDPQTLGLAKNFRVKVLFTLGSPIAFIKKHERRIPGFAKSALQTLPVGRPSIIHPFTKKPQTNVLDWYNLRHDWDPVASLTPLAQATANGALTQETLTFKNFHAGLNAHAFQNYITEYGPFILEKIDA